MESISTLKSRLTEEKIEVADLTNIFSNESIEIFDDPVHVNVQGQKKVNNEMVKLFSRRLKDLK